MSYRRLDRATSDPRSVCPVHCLLKYPKITALLDAERMRKAAEPGTAESMATASPCDHSGDPEAPWHIYVPSKGRMTSLRRKLRKAGKLPRVQDS
jgi:hypothetical protein